MTTREKVIKKAGCSLDGNREYHRLWRKAHPENCRVSARKWRLKHRDQIRRRQRKYRSKTRETRKAKWKIYYAKNREQLLPKKREWAKKNHSNKLSKKYGVDISVIEKAKKSPCAICGGHKRIVIDHDPKTGKFRGGLCNLCNTSLGKMGDCAAGVQKALNYLLEAENQNYK